MAIEISHTQRGTQNHKWVHKQTDAAPFKVKGQETITHSQTCSTPEVSTPTPKLAVPLKPQHPLLNLQYSSPSTHSQTNSTPQVPAPIPKPAVLPQSQHPLPNLQYSLSPSTHSQTCSTPPVPAPTPKLVILMKSQCPPPNLQ